ncbi:MAG TPA: hypothetical protein PKA33_17650 [Amaricoccus sp.]|uniref:hypothetical protein n=1 Tax=Amaricoccus sp. TaxID=1872485 RepID=UPI002CF7E215|nr:hypothetical protein [Amaricoccus sp.]HMQ95073.1 hypothetical protein [Amaricoccus sp.]HMR54156.1 hypothetical protein [Amaricoccus sp.]HMR61979.1 hypothetical protein [Amaricoccus sp.]HMU01173.1 hypothetical protein [Amaricoccus sp.]
MRGHLRLPVLVAAVLLGAQCPAPLSAQAAGSDPSALTVKQVQQRFRRMSPVHILKCDHNGDKLIESKEYPCVQSIYQVMYVER